MMKLLQNKERQQQCSEIPENYNPFQIFSWTGAEVAPPSGTVVADKISTSTSTSTTSKAPASSTGKMSSTTTTATSQAASSFTTAATASTSPTSSRNKSELLVGLKDLRREGPLFRKRKKAKFGAEDTDYKSGFANPFDVGGEDIGSDENDGEGDEDGIMGKKNTSLGSSFILVPEEITMNMKDDCKDGLLLGLTVRVAKTKTKRQVATFIPASNWTTTG